MSFSVEVTTMTQEMNLEDGSMAHFLVLRLPTGALIKALVSDESAQAVVYAKVSGTAPPTQAAAVPRASSESFEPAADGIDGDTMVFGGMAEIPLSDRMALKAEQDFTPPPQKNRIVRVEKDEWGYPIVRTQGGQDPGEVVGGSDPDEDGVSQG